ncbi:MAG TPA: glycosyltransferase family 4 protein [Sedimentisphaerales bacterium]|nr:glycosyltransferase family 4 protein [Sedimentisphaerales bacterium]
MNRILLVNLEGRTAGAEKSLLLLVKHLKSDFVLTAACPTDSSLSDALREMGIDCYVLPAPPRRYRSLWSLAYWLRTAWRIGRIALNAKADIIHANSFKAAAASCPAALLTGRKLIMHARDLSRRGFLFRFCTRHCAKIIAVSRAVKDNLAEQGTQADKVEVVYNGVDDSSAETVASDNTTPGSQHGDNDEFIFAQVGQLAPWKNHTLFLKAAACVAEALPDARFLLIGDDLFGRDSTYRTSLLAQIKDSGIPERVTLTGWQQNMQRVWPRIGCLVHTAEAEPFGRVIIEAMAHKVPVIAADAGGPREIINGAKTGILVAAGDIEALTEAMLHMARHRESAQELAEAGYRHVASNFTADKTAAQIGEIYEEVLAR